MRASRVRGPGRLALAAAVGLAAAVTASTAARPAAAFCRTSSCPNVGTSQVCTPAGPGDCGTPLFWARPCVGWSLQKDASAKTTFAETEKIVTTAFHAWTSAACPGGGTPEMAVVEAMPAVCAKHEYNQMAGNANVVLFHDDKWPYEGSPNTLALTTVTYNLDTGEIYDADLELNSADNHFTTGDSNVMFDLLSIVTHETGHFLGMAHSPDVHATMFPAYTPMTTALRTLSPDDIAGICAIYPPGKNPCACDLTPRHGFSAKCAADQTPADVSGATPAECSPPTTTPGTSSGGCSATPGATPSGIAGAGLAGILGALLLAGRRRRVRDAARPRG